MAGYEQITLKAGAELPNLIYQHLDEDGDPTDFSSGWTFTMTAALTKSGTAVFTKTTGFTGSSTGVTVTFATTGELNSLTAGNTYWLQTRARNGANRDLDLRDVRLTVEATNL